MKCQSSIWRFRQTRGKVNNFAGLRSGDPRSVLISDLPGTYGDSNLGSGVQLIQHASWSDQRPTHPNNLTFQFCMLLNLHVVFHRTHYSSRPYQYQVIFNSWTYFHCITQRTLTQNWIKTVPHNFFNPYLTDSKECFDIPFWTELWKSISQTPNIAKVLIVNYMFTFFAFYI